MRTDAASLQVGDECVVDIGPIAHGGHHIAHTDGATVFVRHAITGERARVRITSASRKIVRADAVEILEPSQNRVPPPCRYAHPDGCGGCDFQHVGLPAQREMKATVIHDALKRFAGLDLDVTVEELPGHPDGLHWRTRMQWAWTPDGQRGLRKHHSHDVVVVDECLIAAPTLAVATGVFSQVHPELADALVERVLEAGQPELGETWWDLYAGAGLFAAALGSVSRVVAVESHPDATRAARRALHAMPQVAIVEADVEHWLAAAEGPRPDGIVLDPPRSGAGRKVVESLLRVGAPTIVYVACDPVALARDLAWLRAGGYRVESVVAYDGFPMTHHVECVAHLTRD